MKNIHAIPTDKPSRLVKFFTNKFHLCKEILPIHDEEQYQNIYITNSEEIKESQVLNKTDYYYVKNHYNEWYVGKFNGVSFDFINDNGNFHSNLFVCKKIILTTDQELIKEGVQAIPDEFLEWFVKNPSCEEIEVNKKRDKWLEFEEKKSFIYKYKIIIPKEETEKETLEEVAEKYATNHGMMAYVFPEKKESFIEGAKWQMKRSYSFDELRLWLIERDVYLYNYYTTYKKSGIPMENVDKYIEDFHEYLMGRKQFKKK